jgi:hypothetical protein
MAFRKVVWETSQETWCRLHEEAFRHFGGASRFVVLDNLKEGVVRPDTYEPELNKLYAAMLAHYGVVADPCRVRDPNRKGTVERAIQHTQDYLKGREFATIEQQNAFLRHWDETRASQRIHGSKKRRVTDMFLEEKPHLRALPAIGFRYFTEEERKVDHAGLVMVKGNRYAALPAPLYQPVKVRIFDDEIVILAQDGGVLRRHRREAGKGKHVMEPQDFMFNPSRDTAKLLERAQKIGPNTAAAVEAQFRQNGRAAHGTIYGIVGLIRTYAREDIERACARASKGDFVSYRSIKAILERTAKPREAPALELQQHAPEIRPVADYQRFWDLHARTNTTEETHDGNDDERGRESAEGSTVVRYVGHA